MLAKTVFRIRPDGSCTKASCTATTTGRHTVTGTVVATNISDTAVLQVNAAPIGYLKLDPTSGSIGVGASQSYKAMGFDARGISLGNLTAKTVFTIGPDGSCTGASCTPTAAGTHTVTGTVSQGGGGRRPISGAADLRPTLTPLAHLALDATGGSIRTGANQAYRARGFDAAGNSLGNFTAKTVFMIRPEGSCTGASCTTSKAGAHTVTGTVNGTNISAIADLAFTALPRRLPLPWLIAAVGAFLVTAGTVAASRRKRGGGPPRGAPQDARAELHPDPARDRQPGHRNRIDHQDSAGAGCEPRYPD